MSEPLTPEQARAVIEAVLLSADSPVAATRLAEVVEGQTPRDVARLVDELREQYQQSQRGFTIVEVAGGYQLATRPELSPWLRRFHKDRAQVRLSQAALEALAIIAFKQPVTRIEIDSIRGVNSSGVMQTLLEVGMIRLVGRSEGIGKPMLFGTTREFLIHFGLKSLAELPRPRELEELLAEGEQKARDRAGAGGAHAGAGSAGSAEEAAQAVATAPPEDEWVHPAPEAAIDRDGPDAGDELPLDGDDGPTNGGQRGAHLAADEDPPDAGDELRLDGDDGPTNGGQRGAHLAADEDPPDAGDELPLDDDDGPANGGQRGAHLAADEDPPDTGDELSLDGDNGPTDGDQRGAHLAADEDPPDAGDELPLDDDDGPANGPTADGRDRSAEDQP